MVWTIVIGGFTLVLVGTGLALLLRRFRGVQLVSPILLDDALDPDLRRLRKALRKSDLSLSRRREIGERLVRIAERRQRDGTTPRDKAELRGVWKSIHGATKPRR